MGFEQVSEEALSKAAGTLNALPNWRKTMGTYVGCMFVDHFALLRQGYGYPSNGPLMTGESLTVACSNL